MGGRKEGRKEGSSKKGNQRDVPLMSRVVAPVDSAEKEKRVRRQ
jgi:hypothetical protein